MDNKFRNKLLFIILGVMVIFPICINLMMSVRIFPKVIPVNGDYQVWVPTLGTFWGAIIGGVISGVLTLFGVNKTIQASFHSLEINSNQINEAREKELELSTAKERIKELYQPIDVLFSEYTYKYGAHYFQGLTEKEQLDFISVLNKSAIYADSELYKKIIELKWAHRENDYENASLIYNKIIDLIGFELTNLREKLKLPSMFNSYEACEIENDIPVEV